MRVATGGQAAAEHKPGLVGYNGLLRDAVQVSGTQHALLGGAAQELSEYGAGVVTGGQPVVEQTPSAPG